MKSAQLAAWPVNVTFSRFPQQPCRVRSQTLRGTYRPQASGTQAHGNRGTGDPETLGHLPPRWRFSGGGRSEAAKRV